MSEREFSHEPDVPTENTPPPAEQGPGSVSSMENNAWDTAGNTGVCRIPNVKKKKLFHKGGGKFEDRQQLYLPLCSLGCRRFGSDILRKSSDALLGRLQYPIASRPPPLGGFSPTPSH